MAFQFSHGLHDPARSRDGAGQGCRRLIAGAVAAVLALAAVLVGVVAPSPAHAAPGFVPAATSCDVSTYYMVANSAGGRSQLYSAAFGSGALSFAPVGASSTLNYNAISINPVDNAMYASVSSQGTDADGNPIAIGDILYIDRATGDVVDLGQAAGIPAGHTFNAGAFGPDGTLYLGNSGNVRTIYALNVTTMTATAISLSSGNPASDFTYLDGYLWGDADNGASIARIDPTTGQVSSFPVPPGVGGSGSTGGAFTFGNGNIGLVNNSGATTQLQVTDPSGPSPAFAVVSVSSSPSAAGTDGASCLAPTPVNLGITKTGPAAVQAGATVTWTLTVTNYGPGTSTGWTVNDAVPAEYTDVASVTPGCTVASDVVTCTGGALDVGGTATITLTGVAPPPTAPAGCVTNTATVLGNDASDGDLPDGVSTSDSATTCIGSFSVQKTASTTTTNPTDVVGYTVTVTNTGGVAYTAGSPASFTDDLSGVLDDATYNGDATGGATVAGDTLSWSGPLAVGASATIAYSVTVKDPDAGDRAMTNTVTPGPSGACAAGASCQTSTDVTAPALSIVKTASPDSEAAYHAGQLVTYSFLVTNTGDVSLTNVHVTETAFTGTGALSPIACPAGIATMAPGAHVTCTATYRLTQSDIDAGRVANTATATGTPPSGPAVNAPPSSALVPADATPAIAILKTANPTTVTHAGQTVTYSFRVTNTGDVTLHAVGVTDTGFTGTGTLSAISCPTSTLTPGGVETCTATYQVTQADVDAGRIDNTATSHGTAPGGRTPTVSHPSAAEVVAPAVPAIAVVKTAITAGPSVDTGGTLTAGARLPWWPPLAALVLAAGGAAWLILRRKQA